jgi:peptidoglycan/LPS O-acetylase OafA/YrhL
MPVEEGESAVYCCCFPSDPTQALVLHAPSKNPSINKECSKRVSTTSFTAIRGFGSVQVAVGHFFTYFARDSTGSEFGGANAVFLFFVMSGFLMMVGYAGKGEKDSTKSNFYFLPSSSNFSKRFVINRFSRIFPVYW